MVDHRSDEAERALHHREHVAWLRGQQADLTEHRRSHEASMRDEEDYAVGSEQSSLRFEGEHSFSIIDDETDGVRYRSLAMPPSFASTEPSQEVTGTSHRACSRGLAGRAGLSITPPLVSAAKRQARWAKGASSRNSSWR